MTSQHNKCLLLGVVYISIAMATVDPRATTCQRLCLRITECSCYLYLSYGTTCPPRIAVENQQNPEMDERGMNCSQDQGTRYARRRTIQCKPSLERLVSFKLKEERREGEMKKLLILPMASYSQQGRQIFLHNNTAAAYPFIRGNHYTAVAFISSLRKLVVHIYYPKKELFFIPLYQSRKDVVKKGIHVRHLAVDDKKRLVFMSIYRHPKYPNYTTTLSVMSTEGKMFTTLVTLGLRVGGIEADHKRSLLYVLCYKKNILRFTYQGVPRGDVPGTRGVGIAFSIDLESDRLYMRQVTSNALFQISLSDYSVTKLTTFKGSAHAIFAIYNTIYVSLWRSNYILAMNVNDPNNVRKIRMGYSHVTIQHVIMCAIP